jgi:hypothetical protein
MINRFHEKYYASDECVCVCLCVCNVCQPRKMEEQGYSAMEYLDFWVEHRYQVRYTY